MAVAREFVAAQHTHPNGTLTLRAWRDGWWQWRASHWVQLQPDEVRQTVYDFTENAVYIDGRKPSPWAPTRHKVHDLLEALAAVCHLSHDIDQPCWLRGAHDGVIVACRNGLLDVQSRKLLPHSPDFFNQTSVPFDYEPEASAPTRWVSFLEELWPDDSLSLETLQEWFGYVVAGRTDLHKILLLVGPTRAGKGVISRTCGKLIGVKNVAGPTLSSLGGEFGLAPLLGKQLAVIADARLQGHGTQTVVERLLSVSGEDLITVNMKFRQQWTGKLSCRFMVISNELPQLGDASMAIVNRFVTLILQHSWLGREDRTLEDQFDRECGGILGWALDGLDRLDKEGRFTHPTSVDDALIAMQDLASPVAAFVRDRCETGPDCQVVIDKLWQAWRAWAQENGHTVRNKQNFGRDLRAVVPSLHQARPRSGNDPRRARIYVGVRLSDQAPLEPQ